MTVHNLALANVFIRHECDRNDLKTSVLDTHIGETYAQCNEDLIVEGLLRGALARAGRGMESLFYIEIGANHPVQTSNSYLFYRKYNASGLLVEANPRLTGDLRRVRPRDTVLEAAVSARHDATLSFNICEISELSSLDRQHIDSFRREAPISEVTVPNLHINAFLEKYGNRPIDFLAVDVEGADLEILEAFDFARYRPLVVQCEPSEHYRPGMAQRMIDLLEAKDYLLAARTDVNLIFLDRRTLRAADARKTVNSFDVFDTLIARRCVEPVRLFEEIGVKLGIPDFATHRRNAEIAVSGGIYTLDDIYRELEKRLNLAPQQAEAIKQAEIEAELETVIPIAENLELVADGDLLLSDMYLGEAAIRRLLDKAGLAKKIELVVTLNGKQSGDLWPKMLTRYAITRHIGDNEHSDVAMPARFGIASAHTKIAAPSGTEPWLVQIGLPDLARLVREARLRSWHRDPIVRRLQLTQVFLNLPILLLSSVRLLRLARQLGMTHLLLASRDCNMWVPLLQTMAARMGLVCKVEYFYTSRIARIQPSPDYLKYAGERLAGDSMMVDLCGSGWSAAILLQKLGLDTKPSFYIHHIKPPKMYEQRQATPKSGPVYSIVGPEKEGLNNSFLEMCNYAEHGSVLDVRYENGQPVPVFERDLSPPAMLRCIAEQRRCFLDTVPLVEKAALDHVLALDDNRLAEIVTALYSALVREDILATVYRAAHQEEDGRTLKQLGVVG